MTAFQGLLPKSRVAHRIAFILFQGLQLLDDVRSHLAERARMSPRHFARAFLAETGTTPARAVESLRAEAARAALQSGPAPLHQVARQCGYADTEPMRRSFVRQFGLTPCALRAPPA
jgi:transcriptional regulator GlxA family with amidase domain